MVVVLVQVVQVVVVEFWPEVDQRRLQKMPLKIDSIQFIYESNNSFLLLLPR